MYLSILVHSPDGLTARGGRRTLSKNGIQVLGPSFAVFQTVSEMEQL